MTSPEQFNEQPVLAFTSEDGIDYYKCSLSGSAGCVAIGRRPDGHILVADDKNPSLAPHTFSPEEWQIFVGGVKHGQFDNPPA